VILKTKKSGRKSGPSSRAESGPGVAGLHLLSDAEMRRVTERIFKFSDADETEVEIGATTDALTRFANNTIRQNASIPTDTLLTWWTWRGKLLSIR
jgi:hypothetical protein